VIRDRRLNWSGLAIAVFLAVLAGAVLAAAYGYSRSSGLFPIFVGWIFLALVLLEAALQLRLILRGGAEERPEFGETGGLADFGGFLWLGLLLVAVYLAGFLIATPVFMFAFLRLSARRPLAQSLLAALSAIAFVYVLFVWLLHYRLYPGALFGA